MSRHLSITATQSLSVDDQNALIAVVQDVPVEHVVLEDGAERMVFKNTTAADIAMDTLLSAFIKIIEKVASRATVIDREDAQSELVLAFVEAVRTHDTTRDVPFSATISAKLWGALSVAQGTSDLIVVPETIALRYWRVMHEANMDVQLAYESCRAHNLAPLTFLAAHHALSVESLDVAVGAPNGDHDAGREELSFLTASPEEQVVNADLVRWLFTQVTERQETILRVRYGFSDLATESLLVAHGLHLGSVLSDLQVAEVTGIGAKTVDRDRRAALKTMRAAYIAALVDVA
jgi:dsDNA-binding SOS-regulon protein